MYLHIKSYIYLAYYNNDLICLDLKKDEYTILNSVISIVISYLMLYPVKYKNKIYIPLQAVSISNSDFNLTTKLLVSKNIIGKDLYNFPCNKIINKKLSSGIKTSEWVAHSNEFANKISFFTLIYNLYILLKVRILIKVFGINHIINLLIKKKNLNNSKPSNNKEINKLRNHLNTACLFFPTKTKCLEWAITYLFIAFKQKIKCNLVIGVQTMPFVAHAWVEYNNSPFSDSLNIASDVVIILSEPF